MEFSYDGFAQSIAVDEYDNVIYWANFDGSNHRIMKTLYTKETTALNITYSGPIVMDSDALILYVLDKNNKRVDKYLKTTLEKQGNITFGQAIGDMAVGFGEI